MQSWRVFAEPVTINFANWTAECYWSEQFWICSKLFNNCNCNDCHYRCNNHNRDRKRKYITWFVFRELYVSIKIFWSIFIFMLQLYSFPGQLVCRILGELSWRKYSNRVAKCLNLRRLVAVVRMIFPIFYLERCK